MTQPKGYRKDGLFLVITKPKTDSPFDLGKMIVLHKRDLTEKSRKAIFGK